MNTVVNQKKLLTSLRTVERVVSKNVSLPILNTVLLKTDGSNLKLSATNLELGINYWLGAKIVSIGEVAVPARVFSDFISNVGDEKVTLASVKNTLSINSEHYKTQILGMDTKDFPIIPKVTKNSGFVINSQALKGALAGVLDSASLSETRPELSGVFVNVSGQTAEFAATDSFRLSEKIISLASGLNKSFILPRSAAMEVARIIEGLDEDINIAVSDNQFFAYGSEFELVSRLVDGHYPEYKRVIPDKFMALAKVNRGELERNIRMASIFTSSIADIKLKVGKEKIDISAKNSDKGEILAHVACELKNEPFEISVNYHYLLDGLKIIPTDNVVIHFTGDGSPLVLRGENTKDQTYVIMPLRS